jgi:hypothetical protein
MKSGNIAIFADAVMGIMEFFQILVYVINKDPH